MVCLFAVRIEISLMSYEEPELFITMKVSLEYRLVFCCSDSHWCTGFSDKEHHRNLNKSELT